MHRGVVDANSSQHHGERHRLNQPCRRDGSPIGLAELKAPIAPAVRRSSGPFFCPMAAFDHLAVNTELVEGPSQSNLRPAVHFLGGNRRHSIITSCVSGGVGQLRFFAAKRSCDRLGRR